MPEKTLPGTKVFRLNFAPSASVPIHAMLFCIGNTLLPETTERKNIQKLMKPRILDACESIPSRFGDA